MLECPCGNGCESPITEENFNKFPQHIQRAFIRFSLWYANELYHYDEVNRSHMPEKIVEALEIAKKTNWPDHEGQILGDSDYIKHLEEYMTS